MRKIIVKRNRDLPANPMMVFDVESGEVLPDQAKVELIQNDQSVLAVRVTFIVMDNENITLDIN